MINCLSYKMFNATHSIYVWRWKSFSVNDEPEGWRTQDWSSRVLDKPVSKSTWLQQRLDRWPVTTNGRNFHRPPAFQILPAGQILRACQILPAGAKRKWREEIFRRKVIAELPSTDEIRIRSTFRSEGRAGSRPAWRGWGGPGLWRIEGSSSESEAATIWRRRERWPLRGEFRAPKCQGKERWQLPKNRF